MTNFFFGPQQAQQLIDTMRVIHGNLFTHQMGNVSPDQVETIIIGAMVGVSEAQFHLGPQQAQQLIDTMRDSWAISLCT